MNLPATLRLRANLRQVECCDCHAWAWDADPIRHSKRCDTRDAQVSAVVAATPASSIARDAGRGAASLHSEDAIVDAVRGHFISESDAMNRDF